MHVWAGVHAAVLGAWLRGTTPQAERQLMAREEYGCYKL